MQGTGFIVSRGGVPWWWHSRRRSPLPRHALTPCRTLWTSGGSSISDVEPETIWKIATVHIHPLQAAVAAMIEAVERQQVR